MPIINVRGLPPNHPSQLQALKRHVKAQTAFTLRLSPDQVSVFFQADLLPDDLGEDIIVTIEGLFIAPERTAEVLDQLRKAVFTPFAIYAKSEVPQCTNLEVFIASQIERQQLASGNPQEYVT